MERPLIYLDSSAIMRLVDGDEPARTAVLQLLNLHSNGYQLVSSVVSIIECKSKWLALNDAERLDSYDRFFSATDMTVLSVDSQIAKSATEVRAATRLKTPDAIHLGTAISLSARHFLTTDTDFLRCVGTYPIRIDVISML